MALGFLRAFGGDIVEARSAGLQPRRRVDPMAVLVMKERGFDIDDLSCNALTAREAKWADLIVHLVAPDEVTGPVPFPSKTIQWLIEDPLGWPRDVYEDIRDEIQHEVLTLVEWARFTLAEAQPVPIVGQGQRDPVRAEA